MAGRLGPLAGAFVLDVQSRERGLGFCVEESGDTATVRYEELPDRVFEMLEIPIERLRPAALPIETRVWLRNKYFGWWPGRVQGEMPGGDYLIKLAGVEQAVPVPPPAVRVRWDRPLQDPDRALAIGMTESITLMEARQPVVRNLIAQRAACHGFTAALSAAVRPYLHQLEVMSRVLGDPVLRYVLADEVGLGKTIEAGLILRQILLDDRSATGIVCVPRTLLDQWRDELTTKLHLGDDLAGGRVAIVEHDDLPLVSLKAPSILIIDEAHQLVERGLEDEVELEILDAAATASPALLLLTATPMRGNARTFLGLLHLVDPTTYRLDDIDAFQHRLDLREEEASAIELLSQSTPPTVLRGVLDDFRESFPKDDLVVESVSRLSADLEAGESADEHELARLGSHLRETYRISRRVVRTRRAGAIDGGFPVSGRTVHFVEVDDSSRPTVDAFLEGWRQVVGVNAEAETVFVEGLERALGGGAALRHFAEARIDRLQACEFEGSATELALLEQTAAALRQAPSDMRLDVAVDVIRAGVRRRAPKFVLFSSFPDRARDAARTLASKLGAASVATHLRGDDRSHHSSSLDRFRSDRSCIVLVCDASAEEGRNLQNATHIIHLDLPLSINRLEQRIGRVDRFSEDVRETGVPNIVLTEPASPWVSNHVGLLHEAVQIFERSVATLTRPLLELEARVVADAFDAGAPGLGVDVETVRAHLDDESDAIDLLEDVESTSAGSEFTAAVVGDFEDFEESWGDTAEAFNRLFSDDGGIRLVNRPDADLSWRLRTNSRPEAPNGSADVDEAPGVARAGVTRTAHVQQGDREAIAWNTAHAPRRPTRQLDRRLSVARRAWTIKCSLAHDAVVGSADRRLSIRLPCRVRRTGAVR